MFQSLMGVFFYTNSVALIEDIPLEEEYRSDAELQRDMDAGFQQVHLSWTFLTVMWWNHETFSWNSGVFMFSRVRVNLKFSERRSAHRSSLNFGESLRSPLRLKRWSAAPPIAPVIAPNIRKKIPELSGLNSFYNIIQ